MILCRDKAKKSCLVPVRDKCLIYVIDIIIYFDPLGIELVSSEAAILYDLTPLLILALADSSRILPLQTPDY